MVTDPAVTAVACSSCRHAQTYHEPSCYARRYDGEVCPCVGFVAFPPRPTDPAVTAADDEETLRFAVAVAIVQGGWDDWTTCWGEHPDDGSACSERCEPLEWHRCDGCHSAGHACACAGIPWLTDETWARMERWFAPFLAAHEAEVRERIVADLRAQRDLFRREETAWIALDLAAARIARGDRG